MLTNHKEILADLLIFNSQEVLQLLFNHDLTSAAKRLYSENRLRHVQMNFPVHFQWDFSRDGEYSDGAKRDRTNQSVRLGIGAFAGFKLGTRQYIEYTNTNGTRVEELQKDNFNMNVFNYGVSAYLAYRSTGFYVKYDLNPLFKNTNVRNISMGIRFDLN